MHIPKKIHIAIPAMNEADWLPLTINKIQEEADEHMQVWVCVNQPESYHDDPEKHAICSNNRQTLDYLFGLNVNNLHVLDHSSPGKGWTGKRHGVGQARKVLMDRINEEAEPEDVLLSLDADTLFDPGYLRSVRTCFERYPHAVALSNPYYHKLSDDPVLNRAMLRYEIYMRYYAINMWRIGSPYNFTALGSAIALPVTAYRKTGGITAKKSGEDFYFLQKLRKTGWICNHNTHKVYPGTRYSDRVFFGTGPALIKGSQGDWESYPIYSHHLFERIQETYACFPALYNKAKETPMSHFLSRQFKESDPFHPLRKNASHKEKFVQACHEKVDGLRLLQFLKAETKKLTSGDEQHLLCFFEQLFPQVFASPEKASKKELQFSEKERGLMKTSGFETIPLYLLNKIRNILMQIEQEYQQKNAS